jgi:ion channel-forming bestrophin family protein
MFVKRNIPFNIIIRFAWKNLLIFTLWSSFWVGCHHFFEQCGIKIAIPFAPLSLTGIAVAFYLGFKNNQSYDRFWEARTIWGGIVNASRNWGNQVMSFVGDHHQNFDKNTLSAWQKILIYRQLAFINALRLNLRKPSSFSQNYVGSVKQFHFGSTERTDWESQIKPFLSEEEYEEMTHFQNMPAQILRRQSEYLKMLHEEKKVINHLSYIEMMSLIRDLYNEQGRCERIKNTPFPRQYAYFSKVFVWIFVMLLPLALTNEFEKIGENYVWLVVPFSVLVSWIFLTIEIVGDNSEDPFENFINDVPMTALCRNIEIDLKEMLGEKDIPPRILPVEGVLM